MREKERKRERERKERTVRLVSNIIIFKPIERCKRELKSLGRTFKKTLSSTLCAAARRVVESGFARPCPKALVRSMLGPRHG
eukprot:6966415-Pyramimonas_sp.AAC.1